MTTMDAEWSCIPEDVCKIIVRHLDLGALVRFGGVCSGWRQVVRSPEAWEQLHMTCWGDVDVRGKELSAELSLTVWTNKHMRQRLILLTALRTTGSGRLRRPGAIVPEALASTRRVAPVPLAMVEVLESGAEALPDATTTEFPVSSVFDPNCKLFPPL